MPNIIRVTLATYSDIKDSIRCSLCHNDSIRWHDLTVSPYTGFKSVDYTIALCNNCNDQSPFDNEGKEKPVFTWWKFLASGGSTPRKK